jgi:hypothetical protein
MLHKTNRIRGFHIHATDGTIGHVDDCLVDEATWQVRYLVVDTSNWIGGRWVLISPTVVSEIDPGNSAMNVSLTREQIKASPSISSADIALAETLPTVWIM